MTSLFAITTTWALVSLSGVMAPGPISAMALTGGTQQGLRAGPLISLGHALTELVMVAALAVGLSQVFQHHMVTGAIGLLGGLFLLWMGYDIAASAWRGRISLNSSRDTAQGVARMGLLLAGVLLSVTNPYWLLWWATVGSATMLSFLQYGLLGLVTFYVSHIAMDFAWNSVLAGVGTSGRRVINEALFRGLLVTCGLFLIAMSGYFVYSGINFLWG